ncbi:MAG: flagellar biosynthesis anti-sigma factor FlgM [Proteobacteria bacterium]|nr:MAG: flagellar biosynthesis anti-sigma factor FlgM [Pseudomonadota bacterium]
MTEALEGDQMDPTRPVDSKLIREPGRKPIGRVSKVNDATTAAAKGSQDATQVADSVATAQRAIAAGKAEAKSVDSARLEELREQVSSGRYHVDAEALADRILDDALGSEDDG